MYRRATLFFGTAAMLVLAVVTMLIATASRVEALVGQDSRLQATETVPIANAWTIQWRADRDLHDVSVCSNGLTIYTVGDKGALYKSVDGGSHWHYQRISTVNLHGVLAGSDGQSWIIGDKGTILYSDDDGQMWVKQQSNTQYNLLGIVAIAGQLWVVGEHGTILYSNDGLTWNKASTPSTATLNAIYFTDTLHGWIVGQHGTLLYTDSGGEHWLAKNSHTAVGLSGVAFSADAENGWIVGDMGTILHSADGGQTWSIIPTHFSVDLHGVAVDNAEQPWVVGTQGFIATVDSLQTVNQHPTDVKTGLSAINISNGVILITGQWNALLRSRDNGNTWDMPNGGGVYEFFDVSFVDTKHGWAVGQRHHQQNAEKHLGIILHTDDGGYSWEVQHFPGESGELEGVSFADTQRGVVTGRYGKALYTEDGGQTWHTQTLPPSANWIYRVEMDKQGNAWAGASFGRLYHSANFGHNWDYYCLHFPASGEGNCRNVFNLTARGIATAGQTVYLMAKDGQMEVGQKIGSNNEHWYRVSLVAGRAANHLNNGYFINPDQGWVVGVAGTLWHTVTGGKHSSDWTLMTPGDTLSPDWRIADLYDVQFANAKTGIVVGGQCDDYSRPSNPAAGNDHLWCIYAYSNDYAYDRAFVATTKDGGLHWNSAVIPSVPLLYEVTMVGNNAWASGAAGAIVHYGGAPSAPIAYQMNVAPTLDGQLNDWPHTKMITLTATTADDIQGQTPSTSDLSGTFQTVWTPRQLLVGIHVTDDAVRTSVTNPLQSDAVILGIDGLHNNHPGGADDHLYLVTADGKAYDWMTPTLAISTATTVNDGGYTVEMGIPAAQILGHSGTLTPTQEIGFSFALQDNDNGAVVDTTLVKDGKDPSKPTSEFGTITLLGRRFTLQQGLNDYSAVQDTYIDRYYPDQNYAYQDREGLPLLHLRANHNLGDVASVLLRFDLSFLPPETKIEEANLGLYVQSQQGSDTFHAALYQLLRDWRVDVVSWLNTTFGETWAKPGANNPMDRAMTPAAEMNIDHSQRWYQWHIPGLVQQWLNHPATNYGAVVRESQKVSVIYRVLSNESSDVTHHPRLEIVYDLYPVATPTPLATATPTATATVTPTPTSTATPIFKYMYLPLLSH